MRFRLNDPPWKKDGPSGAINTKTAPGSIDSPEYIAGGKTIQFKPAPRSEMQLSAGAWLKPDEMARVADSLALHESDFDNRLCGLLFGYVRWIAEQGRKPSQSDALTFLRQRGVCVTQSELAAILETPIHLGDSIADLIVAVQREADDRSAQLCREITRNALRAIHVGLAYEARLHQKQLKRAANARKLREVRWHV